MKKRKLINVIKKKNKKLLSINLLLSEFHEINEPQKEDNNDKRKLYSSHYNTNDFTTYNFAKNISTPLIEIFNK